MLDVASPNALIISGAARLSGASGGRKANCLMFAAGTAKPLGIFVGCIKFILRVAVSALDCGLKSLSPVAQSRSPFLGEDGDQLIHKCLHTPHDLNAGSTVEPDLVKG